jgi:hypothetical protein
VIEWFHSVFSILQFGCGVHLTATVRYDTLYYAARQPFPQKHLLAMV